MKSPITRVGGKAYMASWIISFFPDHEHYIEPFAGALHVLFAKPKSRLETVNDKEGDLVNFWMVCRDRLDELVKKLDFTPYSRQLYEKWKYENMPEEDPVEWAARWYYLNSASVNSFYRAGWSYTRDRANVYVPPVSRFRRRIERMFAACDRLAEVQIECGDFRDMFERYGDLEDAFLYCDPPYVGCKWYKHNFTDEDHRDLAELANAAKAKVMVSYEDCELVRSLYKGWTIDSSEQTRHSKVRRGPYKKPKATELLIMNHTIQLRLDFQEVSNADTRPEAM